MSKRFFFRGILLVLFIYLLWVFFALVPFARFFFYPFDLFGGEKNYLILFQNNYELRPTGGFISSFGILTVKNFIPTSLQFEDVYGTVDDHEYIAPPEPMGKLLAHPTYKGYTFRDANFYPDFPTTVSELQRFLQKTKASQKIDGVIAIDVSFLERLLKVTGPITLNGKEFDNVHILEQMENMVTDIDLHDLEELQARKSGMKDLAKKILRRVSLPWNLPGFFNVIIESFEEKHLLAYFKDEDLQSVVVDKNWGGILDAQTHEDFLAIVDANYGGGKSNRYVNRSVFYYVDLEEGKSSLDIRYDHPADYSLPLSTDYRGYVRAYVPKNHAAQNADLQATEGNFLYAGKTYQIAPRSTQTMHFNFEFAPMNFDKRMYRLRVWKQPGTTGDLYSITVRVPEGMRASSESFETKENIASFRGALDRDLFLAFELEPDIFAPRVIAQSLSELNVFFMEWNEPISEAGLSPEEFRIYDTDKKNPATDKLTIVSAEVSGKRLIIKTNGMTQQPEEQYILELSGVGDYRGNTIQKRTYTFFQRLE